MGTSVSRVQRPREQAGQVYDRLAGVYDRLAGRSERAFREAGVARLAPRPRERILEIGFGTGEALEELADRVQGGGRVDGIDLSDGMRARALARLERSGLLGRVRLHRGDAVHLPYADATFDAVFVCFTLELFDQPDVPRVLDECGRVLRDGGRLVVVAMARSGRDTVSERLYGLGHRLLPRYLDCRPIAVRPAVAGVGFVVVGWERHVPWWGIPIDVVSAVKW